MNDIRPEHGISIRALGGRSECLKQNLLPDAVFREKAPIGGLAVKVEVSVSSPAENRMFFESRNDSVQNGHIRTFESSVSHTLVELMEHPHGITIEGDALLRCDTIPFSGFPLSALPVGKILRLNIRLRPGCCINRVPVCIKFFCSSRRSCTIAGFIIPRAIGGRNGIDCLCSLHVLRLFHHSHTARPIDIFSIFGYIIIRGLPTSVSDVVFGAFGIGRCGRPLFFYVHGVEYQRVLTL